VTGSAVRTTAHKICNASFFAPCGVISPFIRRPPVTLNDAINLTYFYFFLTLNKIKLLENILLFDCYLNELEEQKAQKIIYTTKFSFFNWRYSTTQKIEAALSLKKALVTQEIHKMSLPELKSKIIKLAQVSLFNLVLLVATAGLYQVQYIKYLYLI
jgi:hypothetical protein